MSEAAAGIFIVACLIFIWWRTETFLRGPRIGKRSSISMSVRDGRIHFKGKP